MGDAQTSDSVCPVSSAMRALRRTKAVSRSEPVLEGGRLCVCEPAPVGVCT